MNKYVINGYDIKAIQKVMVEIMAEIDRVCCENGIHYILDGGTMLGAVRHKGFIPWDDDLDIAMLRDDYEKFIAIANEKLASDYRFECIENTKEYPYNFGKVRAVHTKYVEEFTKSLNINHGVYIDVFPMDYVDDSNMKKLNHVRWWVARFTSLRYAKLKLTSSIKFIPFLVIPLSVVNSTITRIMKYNYKNKGNRVNKLCHFGKNKPVIDASLFTDVIRVPFENYEFFIPREYDSFLRGRYGNYMELPPEEKQKPCHNINEVKL